MSSKEILKIDRFDVLGVAISALSMEYALKKIDETITKKERGYVCVTGVHGVIEAQRDSKLREILSHSLLTTPDGMPMVWLGKLFGFKRMDRVYGPDLMLDLCRASEANKYRHFFYGGGEGVADALRDKLTQTFPFLNVVGTYTPPFRSLDEIEENELIVQIAKAKPDIIWVGLSTPKQEKFMAEYLDKLDTRVMIGVGAAFDFHAGTVKQAPRWIQRSGFEWFFRLCQEPRRLWRRYVYNNSQFVFKILLQLMTTGDHRSKLK